MKKTMSRTLIATVLFAVMFAVMSVSGIRAEAASKKPAAVKKIETVKVTKNSIKIKYSKAKRAKRYQVTVYNGKEQVKSMKVKNTSCTVKNLKPDIQYTVRVCGYNGKTYGKKASAKIYTANKDGIVKMGRSTATNKALEKEYKAWSDYVVKKAEEYGNQSRFLDYVASEAGLLFGSRLWCTGEISNYQGDPNKYDKKKVYETYKKGKGTNLEMYHILLDIIKNSGKIECEILEDDGKMIIVDWTNEKYFFISRGRVSGGTKRRR